LSTPAAWKLVLAFASVYLIWGSTYLAIRFGVQTIPPFTLASVRFFLAGGILLAIAVAQGARRPTARHWVSAAVIGAFLPLGGNGLVTWAAQRITSGFTALMIATVPMWVVLIDWIRPGGKRPGASVLAGVAAGIVGVALLTSPGGGETDPIAILALLMAALLWASGSVYSRYAAYPGSPLLATAMQLFCGAVYLLILGIITGEPSRIQVESISRASIIALVYLVVFGAVIGYTAYIWLVRVTTPAKAATYAFVNPAIAVVLARLFDGEHLSVQKMIAAVIIIGAVVIIVRGQEKAAPPDAARLPESSAD
jgi:drug/metabolite transporter (DMT)-like permease